MPESPTVSVWVPAFDHERYLAASLDSIFAQTWRDYEIVLVDNGSSDSTLDIARAYAARCPSIMQVLTHPGHVNLGILRICNFAVEHCKGKYLAGIGSDDAWYPDHLQSLVEVLEHRPQIGLVYGRADIINANGDRIDLSTLQRYFSEAVEQALADLDSVLWRSVEILAHVIL